MEIRVLVGIPGAQWDADCGLSLINLTAYFAVNRVPGAKLQTLSFNSVKGSILPQLRTDVVKTALKQRSTHLLFIDADQTFPADTLHRLLAVNKPVVACNVATKQFPSMPTGRAFSKDDRKGIPVYTYPEDSGLASIWRIGTGIMLINMQVFKVVKEPWFPVHWTQEADGSWHFIGEDWALCERLDSYGIKPYILQDLSYQIGHKGIVEFTHDMCIAEKLMEGAYEGRKEGSKDEQRRDETLCVGAEEGQLRESSPGGEAWLQANREEESEVEVEGR
jgi:hypothetical protein